MLALTWNWPATSPDRGGGANRLARSLCAGIGGAAAAVEIDGLELAYRPRGAPLRRVPSWQPIRLADGRLLILHGYIDNSEALRVALGSIATDDIRLYGEAVERWGDEADLQVVGDYCSVVVDVARGLLRLARSPLRAPPLMYAQDGDGMMAGSVPRTFFASGLPQVLNEDRVVDSAVMNFTDNEATYFKGLHRVPHGCVVELARRRPRRLVRYYDPLAVTQREIGDEEALQRVRDLLDEAVRACLKGSRAPGLTLSGGLDSPQIAVRALDARPDARFPTFTFVPEPGYDGVVEPGHIGDERAMVEAFAAMHPRLDPHFTANEDYGHLHRMAEIFHLMGGAPAGITNMYVFHGLFSAAAAAGCDRLLVGEWGNHSFSEKGSWAYVEYFRTGRWRQLYRALKAIGGRPRPLWWRFGAQTILPLLPDRWWEAIRNLILGRGLSPLENWQPFTAAFRERSGVDRRRKEGGHHFGRYQPRNVRHARYLLLRNDDAEGAETYQAFEQLYGIVQRDPLAYRPLVEFCWSLPTRMFVRDGEVRWLAKELSKGIMPETQRENSLNGRWDADWHLRVGRKRAEWLGELKRLETDERFAGMFDVERMISALEDWPDRTPTDEGTLSTLEFSIPHALLASRFIKWVEGRNER